MVGIELNFVVFCVIQRFDRDMVNFSNTVRFEDDASEDSLPVPCAYYSNKQPTAPFETSIHKISQNVNSQFHNWSQNSSGAPDNNINVYNANGINYADNNDNEASGANDSDGEDDGEMSVIDSGPNDDDNSGPNDSRVEDMEWQTMVDQAVVVYDVITAPPQFDKRHHVNVGHTGNYESTQYERLELTDSQKIVMRQWELPKCVAAPNIAKRQSAFENFDFTKLQRYKDSNNGICAVPYGAKNEAEHEGWSSINLDGYRILYAPFMPDIPVNNTSVKVGDEDNFLQSLVVRDLRGRSKIVPLEHVHSHDVIQVLLIKRYQKERNCKGKINEGLKKHFTIVIPTEHKGLWFVYDPIRFKNTLSTVGFKQLVVFRCKNSRDSPVSCEAEIAIKKEDWDRRDAMAFQRVPAIILYGDHSSSNCCLPMFRNFDLMSDIDYKLGQTDAKLYKRIAVSKLLAKIRDARYRKGNK